MPDFERIELKNLAAQASDILTKELLLHGFDHAALGTRITGAEVRAVLEALEDAGYLVTRLRTDRVERLLAEMRETREASGDGEHDDLGPLRKESESE